MMWIVTIAMMLMLWLILMQMQLKKLEAKHEAQIDNLETCLAKLTEVVAEVKEPELDPIEKRIQEAKQEVFEEWINNITNYTPYGKGN